LVSIWSDRDPDFSCANAIPNAVLRRLLHTNITDIASSHLHSTMNIDSDAADVYLRLSRAFRGVDAVVQPASGVQFPLYSSSGSSRSSSSSRADSADSSISSSSSLSSMEQGDDDSSISSVETDSSEDTMDRFMSNFSVAQAPNHHNYANSFDGSDASFYEEDDELHANRGRKERDANRWEYEFGDYFQSNYYNKFLRESIRAITYQKSRDRRSVFRSHFRVPLVTIDHLTEMFMARGWVNCTKRCNTRFKLFVRTQLFIMCALEHLGNKKPHCQFDTDTNMSPTEHQKFFDVFLDRLYENRGEYIMLPPNMEALRSVQNQYADVHLPGAMAILRVFVRMLSAHTAS
jgi:hypothetical protein